MTTSAAATGSAAKNLAPFLQSPTVSTTTWWTLLLIPTLTQFFNIWMRKVKWKWKTTKSAIVNFTSTIRQNKVHIISRIKTDNPSEQTLLEESTWITTRSRERSRIRGKWKKMNIDLRKAICIHYSISPSNENTKELKKSDGNKTKLKSYKIRNINLEWTAEIS